MRVLCIVMIHNQPVCPFPYVIPSGLCVMAQFVCCPNTRCFHPFVWFFWGPGAQGFVLRWRWIGKKNSGKLPYSKYDTASIDRLFLRETTFFSDLCQFTPGHSISWNRRCKGLYSGYATCFQPQSLHQIWRMQGDRTDPKEKYRSQQDFEHLDMGYGLAGW